MAGQLWPCICLYSITVFLHFRKWKQRPHRRRLLTADRPLWEHATDTLEVLIGSSALWQYCVYLLSSSRGIFDFSLVISFYLPQLSLSISSMSVNYIRTASPFGGLGSMTNECIASQARTISGPRSTVRIQNLERLTLK